MGNLFKKSTCYLYKLKCQPVISVYKYSILVYYLQTNQTTFRVWNVLAQKKNKSNLNNPLNINLKNPFTFKELKYIQNNINLKSNPKSENQT